MKPKIGDIVRYLHPRNWGSHDKLPGIIYSISPHYYRIVCWEMMKSGDLRYARTRVPRSNLILVTDERVDVNWLLTADHRCLRSLGKRLQINA